MIEISFLKVQNLKLSKKVLGFTIAILISVAIIVLFTAIAYAEENLSPPKSKPTVYEAEHSLNTLINIRDNNNNVLYLDYNNIGIKQSEIQCIKVLMSFIAKLPIDITNSEVLQKFIKLQISLGIPQSQHGYFGPKMIKYFGIQIKTHMMIISEYKYKTAHVYIYNPSFRKAEGEKYTLTCNILIK